MLILVLPSIMELPNAYQEPPLLKAMLSWKWETDNNTVYHENTDIVNLYITDINRLLNKCVKWLVLHKFNLSYLKMTVSYLDYNEIYTRPQICESLGSVIYPLVFFILPELISLALLMLKPKCCGATRTRLILCSVWNSALPSAQIGQKWPWSTTLSAFEWQPISWADNFSRLASHTDNMATDALAPYITRSSAMGLTMQNK